MSNQIETHRVVQFATNVLQIAQQNESRLRRGCTEKEHTSGKRISVDYLGTTVAAESNVRHGDTPLEDTPHIRRWILLKNFKHADMVDKADKLRTLTDPTGEYAVNFGKAFGRAIDDNIIANMLGTAYTGEEATGTSDFSTSNQRVAVAGAGLTLAKLLEANRRLRAAEFQDEFFIAVSAIQVEDMLGDSTFTSADYNSIRTLMSGEITQFMGFTWIMSERLLTTGGDRRCIAWAKEAVAISFAAEPFTRIGERPGKSYGTQVYMEMDMGTSRVQDTGLVDIICDE